MATVTDLGFTLTELMNAVTDSDVRVQTHPDFPELAIFNYTEDVQYRNRWNNITLACRGLILNSTTGEVVARPWEKFFNLGQRDNRIDSLAPVEVTDKMDGSLGILYKRPDGVWAIATRGSFASEQALHATEILHQRYDTIYLPYAEDNTVLFEIIYPENRIVVNYDGMDDLVVLGSVNKERGYYMGPVETASQLAFYGPVTEVFKFENFIDAISNWPQRDGKEGVVIRSGTNMVKLKQADYVELHRIVTNLSPKTIWEMLQRGETVASICAEIPDEFHSYVETIGTNLLDSFTGIKVMAKADFLCIMQKLGGDASRRKYAEEIKKCEHPSLLFSLLDGRDIDESIWKMIKPRGDVKSLVSDEG